MQKVTDPSILAALNGGTPAPAPSQQQAPVFIPNRSGQRSEQRDQTRTDIAVEGNDRANQQFGNDVENRRAQLLIQQADKYNKDPTIAGYRESLGNFATGLRTSPTPQGDNALITAYVKVFDPGSVVNEGEREGVSSGQGYLASQIEAAKRNFGMNDAGLFTDEARKRIRAEMSNIMGKRVKGYNERRAYYERQSQDIGLDPSLIIGQHDAAPFVDQFREYDRANGLGEFAKRDERGPIPGATADNITFDIDTGTGAFGSQLQADRLTAAQQNALDAFLKANAGNPNFGPDQLGSFYRSIGVEGAVPASPAFFEAVKSGKPFDTTPDPSAADAEIKRRAMEASYSEIPEGGDVSAAGRDKGLLLNLTDEARGLVGGVKSLAQGDGFMSGYQQQRDIERALQERSREENGLAPELIGGLMTPAGIISRANMVRDSAAMAAIAGFGEGDGAADSLGKAATGAVVGHYGAKALEAAAPYLANSAVGQRVSQALAREPNADQQAFAEAAERQGLDYLAADIPGATKSRFATSVAKSTLGGIPLAEAAGKIVAKARDARDRIAGNVGDVANDATGAGQAAQRGLEAWERKTAGRGGELYDAIPIKPDTPVDLTTTRQTLADLNNSISSNEDLAALVRDPRMESYQKALENGGLSWEDTKRFRSFIGEKAGRPTLQQDTSKDSLDALYGALSQDIERAAAAHSPEAAKAFSRANNYWRGRQSRLSDVMTKLVGKGGEKSPEATFAQIERWASAKGGDFSSLARTIRSLPEDEANTVRATIIDRLGDSNPGSQNAANDNFSPDLFLTQWSKLSDRAKGVLFQGEHRKALDDLATVFEGSKFARGFDNTSKTSIGVNVTALLGTGLVSPTSAVALSALQFGGGKLLASPRFARWIVALGKKPNESAQLAHINQLTAIARSEPIIANDIFSLQQRLAEQFQKSPTPLAAQESGDGRGEPPAQGERGNAP